MGVEEFLNIEEEHKREFSELLQYCLASGRIDQNLYQEYDVKRGLRDSSGKGVLTGLTEISDVVGYTYEDGRKIPADGQLFFQGYNVADMVASLEKRKKGFEEVIYTLLFGRIPNARQSAMFNDLLSDMMNLNNRFIRDVVMKASNENIMNAMQRCVLTLYTYDDNPDNTSVENALRQSMQLIAKMPLIAVYSYHSYRHFRQDENLLIKNPKKEYSFSENILYMLREDGQFTELEAKVLDIALVLHAEHGGGNNSTFTNHVVTSSGTDTYSAVAASIGSLKGPKHGGANIKVVQMFKDMKKQVKDWTDEEEVGAYLRALLHKEAFDKKGLIYGMGHAVYSISDPRAEIFKGFVQKLAHEKGKDKDFALYSMVEQLAPKIIGEERHIYKGVSANVDFYSGFVYSMLDLPTELFTPMFAIARIVGWSAHRMEELINMDKIIRPAYKTVKEEEIYRPLEER